MPLTAYVLNRNGINERKIKQTKKDINSIINYGKLKSKKNDTYMNILKSFKEHCFLLIFVNKKIEIK